jgi:GrpB-like predicted nucleotidyltransferase (UPF0157 family)/protein associated with RNAse G/E
MTTIGLAKGTVQLQPYTPVWADLYRAEEAQLRAHIGQYVLDIQHVGSTSIPGIPAKPIIDIGVGVANFEEAAVCIAPLQQLGYGYMGEFGIPRRHYFVKGEPRTYHLHMNEVHSSDWQQQIAFRDYLRSYAAVAQAYAELKLRLAQQFPTDRLAYTEQKSGFIFNVLRKALPGLMPQPGACINVRLFRSNGEGYRWWTATVEAIDDDSLTTFDWPGNPIHQPQGGWISQSAIRARYWFDRPYVLLESYQVNGTLNEIYIHISSPSVVKGNELHLTDHELDVVKRLGQAARIVDEDEFAAAAVAYGYSSSFQNFCQQVAQEALALAEAWVPVGLPTR